MSPNPLPAPMQQESSHVSAHTMGGFGLEFDADGKLRTLRLPGGARPLHQPDYVCELGQGRVYRVGGWDECFPTIESYADAPVMGDLIASTPKTRQGSWGIQTVWTTPRYTARRTFSLRDAHTLQLAFDVRNGPTALDFLWASHAIFATDTLQRVVLPDGQVLQSFSGNGTCRKFFVAAGRDVEVHGQDYRLCMSTDQPYWGTWLNRGGWPAAKPAGFCCIGLEATNAACDAPAGARLAPKQAFRGHVLLNSGSPARWQ